MTKEEIRKDNLIALLVTLIVGVFVILLMVIFFGFTYYLPVSSDQSFSTCSPFCDDEWDIEWDIPDPVFEDDEVGCLPGIPPGIPFPESCEEELFKK